MIHIKDDLYIDVQTDQYVLTRKVISNGEKTKGNVKYIAEGYYPTLESTIRGCRNISRRDKLKDLECELTEAIERIKAHDEEFNALLKDKIPEERH